MANQPDLWATATEISAVSKGLTDLHLAVNRAIVSSSIKSRAEMMVGLFDGYSVEMIERFFSWCCDNLEKLPTNREFSHLISTHKLSLSNNQPAGGSFYGPWGEKILFGTYFTVQSCTLSQWLLLASKRAKELQIKAKHNLLGGPELQEWDGICKKKVSPYRGKIQKPQEEWDNSDWDYYKRFMDSFNAEMAKWAKYEEELIEKNKLSKKKSLTQQIKRSKSGKIID